jgi:hypothetical protein
LVQRVEPELDGVTARGVRHGLDLVGGVDGPRDAVRANDTRVLQPLQDLVVLCGGRRTPPAVGNG